mgnify:CR=1 FL=1
MLFFEFLERQNSFSIIKEEKVKDVLLGIHKGTAVLKVVLDNNTEMEFIASKDLINRIEEAFHK